MVEPEIMQICENPTRKYPQGRKGTVAGQQAHRKAGEEPCEPCREAYSTYHRERYQAEKTGELIITPRSQWRTPAEGDLVCDQPSHAYPQGRRGTVAGERLHQRAGEPLCDECQATRSQRHQKAYAKKQVKVRESWRTPQPGDLICETPSHKFPQGTRGAAGGYARHKNAGEEPCDECREAYRLKSAERWHETSHLYAERKNEYQRGYRKENHEKYKVISRERALKKGITTDWHSWDDITAEHGNICYLCETEVDLELEHGWSDSKSEDHVIPIHLEGSPGDVIENVRWTHMRCNLRKGRKTVEQLELPMEPPGHDRYGMENEHGR